MPFDLVTNAAATYLARKGLTVRPRAFCRHASNIEHWCLALRLAVRTSEEELTSEGVTASFRQLLPEVVFAGVIATTTGDAPLHACMPDSTAHSAGRYAQRACVITFSASWRVSTLLGLASWRPLRLLVRGSPWHVRGGLVDC